MNLVFIYTTDGVDAVVQSDDLQMDWYDRK